MSEWALLGLVVVMVLVAGLALLLTRRRGAPAEDAQSAAHDTGQEPQRRTVAELVRERERQRVRGGTGAAPEPATTAGQADGERERPAPVQIGPGEIELDQLAAAAPAPPDGALGLPVSGVEPQRANERPDEPRFEHPRPGVVAVDAGPVGPPWNRGFVDGVPVEAPRPAAVARSQPERRSAVDPALVARVTSVQPPEPAGRSDEVVVPGSISPAVAEAVARAEAAHRASADREPAVAAEPPARPVLSLVHSARTATTDTESGPGPASAPDADPSTEAAADATVAPLPPAVGLGLGTPGTAPDAAGAEGAAEVSVDAEEPPGVATAEAAEQAEAELVGEQVEDLTVPVEQVTVAEAQEDGEPADAAEQVSVEQVSVAAPVEIVGPADAAEPVEVLDAELVDESTGTAGPGAAAEVDDTALPASPAEPGDAVGPADVLEPVDAGLPADGAGREEIISSAEVAEAERVEDLTGTEELVSTAEPDEAGDRGDSATDGAAALAAARAAEHAAVDLALLRTLGFADPNPRPGAAPVVDMSVDHSGEVEEPVDEAQAVPVHFRVWGREQAAVPDPAATLLDARGRTTAKATGDGGGSGTVVAPRPGNFVLVASGAGYQPGVVALTVGEEPVEVDVQLTRSSSVSGTVSASSPQSPTVTLLQDGEVLATVEVDAVGGYRFDDLAAGEYTLAAVVPGAGPVAIVVRLDEEQDEVRDITVPSVSASMTG